VRRNRVSAAPRMGVRTREVSCSHSRVQLSENYSSFGSEGRAAGRPTERVPMLQLLTIIIAQGDWRAHSQIYDSLFG
jgi:hypothetical protein